MLFGLSSTENKAHNASRFLLTDKPELKLIKKNQLLDYFCNTFLPMIDINLPMEIPRGVTPSTYLR
jgi:hypothetical protein